MKPFVKYISEKMILRLHAYRLYCIRVILASIFIFPLISSAQIDFGKSYVNISKPTSGTVEPGDILEIRASISIRSGTYDSCRFQDNIPTGTTFISGTLRILTNEGKIFRQYTDAQYDASNDAGWISGTAVTINLGTNAASNPATHVRRGRLRNTYKPLVGNNASIVVASYRVTVTAAIGSIINTGGGNITYGNNTFTFPSNPVAIYTNYGMCSNSVGTNSIGTEFNGTFGSGPTRNRGTSVNVPLGYTYSIFTNNGPNDFYYGIANNTSTQLAYTTSNSWAKPDNSSPTHRVFNLWDVIGDHTGATNPLLGNPAADTVANNNAGYMLIVNAAYRIDSAFQQTISNLCPNTYYEISCWMRNICSKCGCDSNGVWATGSGYIPTALNDSAGVQPNITFEVDNVDYYTTGNIPYTGQWVKKGFVYKTGPAQNSFVLKFFNNAPGGGGNDWALDDISVATCLPNMSYSPTITPNVCRGNALTIYDTVRSYFNNYTEYKWQRSTNNGISWADVTSPTTATPVLNGSTYQFISSYTIPSANTNAADSGNLYRLVVATTTTNLSDANCRSTDPTTIVTLNTLNCDPVLDMKLISFNGNVTNKKAMLQWSTTDERNVVYELEKSSDGINFSVITTINGYGNNRNYYYYTDPAIITQKIYYRLKVRTPDNKSFYSRILLLSESAKEFSFVSVINPFRYTLSFDIS